MRGGSYVVRRRRPWLEGGVVITLVIAAIVGGHLLWSGGLSTGRAEALSTQGRRDPARDPNEHLRARIAALEADNEALRRGSGIAERRHASMRRALEQQRSELLELREEVAFFRTLALEPDETAALTISNFRLRGPTGDGRLHYRLVLTRTDPEGAGEAAGSYSIELVGRDESGLRRLAADTVMTGGPEVPFAFRHYGRLDGTLRLPEGIRPLRVSVRVQVSRLGEEAIELTFERTFEWYSPTP